MHYTFTKTCRWQTHMSKEIKFTTCTLLSRHLARPPHITIIRTMAAGRAVGSTWPRGDPGLTRPTDPCQPSSTDSLSEDKPVVTDWIQCSGFGGQRANWSARLSASAPLCGRPRDGAQVVKPVTWILLSNQHTALIPTTRQHVADYVTL